MNFEELFKTQAVLDAAIIDKHPELKDQDKLSWKVLALQVELGECANEWRGFKKWSNDQEPRTFGKCRQCSGEGEGYFSGNVYTAKKEKCVECNGTGKDKKVNPLLEEYVDCLHFALSIGLELGVRVDSVYLLDKYQHSVTQQFSGLMVAVGLLAVHGGAIRNEAYKDIFAGIVRLGLKLGFTLEQIESAYHSKNQINHERQTAGY